MSSYTTRRSTSGGLEDNVQVKEIADLVRDAVPGSRVSLAEDAGPDMRNYRVDFSKLAGTFPDLELHWRVRDGVNELVGAYARHGLTYDDFMSARFVRLRRIRELVSASLVDDMLRRQASGAFPDAERRDHAATPVDDAGLGDVGGPPAVCTTRRN